MSNKQTLHDIVSSFPMVPGVYKMLDNEEQILYVGKAKALKKRVQSYLRSNNTERISLLMSHVSNIEYIVTDTEFEALLLEHNLIKSNQPKYNILLRDDKTFPMFKITKEEYPRVLKTRTMRNDGGQYFGPYVDGFLMKTYLDFIGKNFALRRCKKIKPREKPCLYYHIGRCTAVCANLTTKKEYLDRVKKIKSLLNGKTKILKKEVTIQMHNHAQKQEYEEAARCRNILCSIELIESKQNMIYQEYKTSDYIGISSYDNYCCIIVVHMQEGRVVDQNTHILSTFDSLDDTLEQFLLSYYHKKELCPQTIYLPQKASDVIKEFFLKYDTNVQTPNNKSDIAIIRFAKENAHYGLRRRITQQGNKQAIIRLQEVLGLSQIPTHIEGFDIATMEGNHTNASMVYFYNGVPDKKKYRHFSIKSLATGETNDFQSIEEAVSRRYSKLKNEKISLPHLIVIDGGLGQVNAAKKILDLLALSIPIIGLAKKKEEIFFPGTYAKPNHVSAVSRNPLQLALDDPASKLLQSIRDEAHRFATNFRAKKQLKDLELKEYTKIKGIGIQIAKKIADLYATPQAIIDAKPEILASTLTISLATAKKLQDYIKNTP